MFGRVHGNDHVWMQTMSPTLVAHVLLEFIYHEPRFNRSFDCWIKEESEDMCLETRGTVDVDVIMISV